MRPRPFMAILAMISSQLALRAGRSPCRSHAGRGPAGLQLVRVGCVSWRVLTGRLLLSVYTNPASGAAEHALRRANQRLLVRASPDELKRVGVHLERGEESGVYLNGMRDAVDRSGSGVHWPPPVRTHQRFRPCRPSLAGERVSGARLSSCWPAQA